ncbi:unnamed protein product, partial [Closterium sp. NIES-54]
HADASWADDQATQRSSQGYTFSLGSGSVSWRATRLSSVLSSSCEAEIYDGAMAAQELRWLTYLLTDLGEPPRSPPVLYVDNKAMLALCREQRLEHRTKHIALRYFLARELQQRGQLRLAYVASEANTADVFTKALAPCDHQRFCTQLEPGGAEPRGAHPGGAESRGAEPGGVEPGGAEPGGTEPGCAEPGGAVFARVASGGASLRQELLSPQELREWFAQCWSCAAGAGGATVAATPGGAPTGSTGAAGTGGAARAVGVGLLGGTARAAGGTGADGRAGAGAARAGVAGGVGAGGAAGAGAFEGAGVGTAGAGGAASASAAAGGTGAVPAGFGGATRPRPYFIPLLEQVLGLPPSTGPSPPLECPQPIHSRSQLQPASPLPAPSPYTGPTGGLAEVSDSLRAASPTVTRLLATVVTDPSFKSTPASALVTELVDFADRCRLDYAASLVAESESVCPPSVGGEYALSSDILEDRQEEFQCFAAALPHLWQSAMDAEMASWKSTGTYVDEVPPPGANIVSGMWIFRVKRPPGSPLVFKARYLAQGFTAQRDYELHSLDFSTAFLRGSLHEEIWLRHPPGFTGLFPLGTQWSLRRPVYGLRRAPREWHDILRTTLAALGFAPSTADPSLFLRTDTSCFPTSGRSPWIDPVGGLPPPRFRYHFFFPPCAPRRAAVFCPPCAPRRAAVLCPLCAPRRAAGFCPPSELDFYASRPWVRCSSAATLAAGHVTPVVRVLSPRMKCAMLSSTESEYVAATEAGKEESRLRAHGEAICLAAAHGEAGAEIPTTKQRADFLTKAPHFPAFNRCSVAIGQVHVADVGDGVRRPGWSSTGGVADEGGRQSMHWVDDRVDQQYGGEGEGEGEGEGMEGVTSQRQPASSLSLPPLLWSEGEESKGVAGVSCCRLPLCCCTCSVALPAVAVF